MVSGSVIGYIKILMKYKMCNLIWFIELIKNDYLQFGIKVSLML